MTSRNKKGSGQTNNPIGQVLNLVKAGDLERAYQTAGDINNPLWRIGALAQVAKAFIGVDIERACQIAEEVNDFYFGSSLWENIAKSFVRIGNLEKALQTIRKIPAGADFSREEVLVDIIRALVKGGDIEKARQLAAEVSINPVWELHALLAIGEFEKARAIAERGKNNPISQGQFLLDIALATNEKNDIEKALRVADAIQDASWKNYIRQPLLAMPKNVL